MSKVLTVRDLLTGPMFVVRTLADGTEERRAVRWHDSVGDLPNEVLDISLRKLKDGPMTDENTKPTDEPDALPDDDDEPEASAPDLASADEQEGDGEGDAVTDTAENDQPQEGGK